MLMVAELDNFESGGARVLRCMGSRRRPVDPVQAGDYVRSTSSGGSRNLKRGFPIFKKRGVSRALNRFNIQDFPCIYP